MTRIVIGKYCRKGAPDLHGRGCDYYPGQTVYIDGWIDWPGKPAEPGTLAAAAGKLDDEWAFWGSCDIDLALIFDADEVAELILTPERAAKIPPEVLAAAPFKVTLEPAERVGGSG
jgi:hypothetical protein